MTTIVEKTIGTGGDYADIVAWFNAAPASLVTADQVWRGKLLKQKHTVAVLNMTGKTVDATRYFELTTDTGASIFDAPVAKLAYDPTAGAAIEISTGYDIALQVNLQYTRISKIQFACTNTSANANCVLFLNADNCTADRVIVDGYTLNSVLPMPLKISGASTISNSLVVQRANVSTCNLAVLTYGAKAYNCAFVSLNTKLAKGFITGGVPTILTNCYVGNVTACEDGAVVMTKTNCFSDSGSAGYGMAAFSNATFANIGPASYDFRLVAGSPLIDAGTTVSQGAVSIDGTARPYGSAYDVGPWEYHIVDTTAPTLSAPAASATSASAASGSVATDEAGGTLYFMVSANATETAATVKTGSSQAVAATGAQNVAFTGLAPATTYYAHYVQVDAAGNTSAVANSTSFATPALDTTAPTWPGGAVITAGTITTTSLAFSYPAASDNVGVHHYETSKDNGATWQNNGTGLSGTFTGLASGTTYPIAVSALDAQGNRSLLLTKSMTTTAVATTGSFKTMPLANNTGTLYAAGQAVAWEWHQARVGTSGSVTYGAGTVAADGTLTATGLPTGAGYLLAAILGAALANDKPYYQPGTAA